MMVEVEYKAKEVRCPACRYCMTVNLPVEFPVVTRSSAHNAGRAVVDELLAVLKDLTDNDPGAASEIDGSVSCFYCNAFLQIGEQHSAECAWLAGRTALAKEACNVLSTSNERGSE